MDLLKLLFFDAYGNKINSSKNIKYHGFIEPGRQKFNQLASECSYVIFHSSAEGCYTSVATAMKAGLVPIVNSWTGINTTDLAMPNFGNLIDIVDQYSNIASKLPDFSYFSLVNNTIEKSKNFSQKGYRESFTESIKTFLSDNI